MVSHFFQHKKISFSRTIGLLPTRGSILSCFSIDGENIYHIDNYAGACIPVNAIEEHYQNKTTITLYPNPANTTFQIKGIDNFQNVSVSVYNIYGQLVISEQNLNENSIIRIENLHKGVYIVNIFNKNNIVATCKLIKL